MRKLLLFAMVAVLAIQLPALARTESDDLSFLQLLGPNGQTGFDLDLACAGETTTSGVQCATVSNAFEAWANGRQIKLRSIGKDDPEFDGKSIPAQAPAAAAYRVAILFQPIVVPAMHLWGGTFNQMASGSSPGSVGYRAAVFIYDANSGVLVRKMKLHDRKQLPDDANVTPAMAAEVQAVIAKLDPGYTP